MQKLWKKKTSLPKIGLHHNKRKKLNNFDFTRFWKPEEVNLKSDYWNSPQWGGGGSEHHKETKYCQTYEILILAKSRANPRRGGSPEGNTNLVTFPIKDFIKLHSNREITHSNFLYSLSTEESNDHTR